MSSSTDRMSGKFVFLGSPLIDLITHVGKEFIDKFGLKEDEITTVDESSKTIFEEIINYNPTISVGGTVTNTARIVNHLLKSENVTMVYLGSIGKDEYGVKFKEELKREGIDFVLKEIENLPTGKVAVLIADRRYRCMVTDLAASHVFEIEQNEDAFSEVINLGTFIYFSGLFLNVNRQLIRQLIMSKKRIFFNLGAAFVVKKYIEDVSEICSHAALIFGNESEYEALFSPNFSDTNDFMQSLLGWASTIKWQQETILVVTRGAKSVYVLETHTKEFREYFFKLEHDKIEDTDGAGDAFAGGFLAQYLTNQPIDLCVACGLYAAQEVLKHVGFGFDHDIKFRPEISTISRVLRVKV